MSRPASYPLHLYLAYREAGFTAHATAHALQVSASSVNAKYAQARAAGLLSPLPRPVRRTPKEAAHALAKSIAKQVKAVPEGADQDALLEALAAADAHYKEL